MIMSSTVWLWCHPASEIHPQQWQVTVCSWCTGIVKHFMSICGFSSDWKAANKLHFGKFRSYITSCRKILLQAKENLWRNISGTNSRLWTWPFYLSFVFYAVISDFVVKYRQLDQILRFLCIASKPPGTPTGKHFRKNKNSPYIRANKC